SSAISTPCFEEGGSKRAIMRIARDMCFSGSKRFDKAELAYRDTSEVRFANRSVGSIPGARVHSQCSFILLMCEQVRLAALGRTRRLPSGDGAMFIMRSILNPPVVAARQTRIAARARKMILRIVV